MPIVNVYGFLLTSRVLPDGKDLNRSFPGSKTGSLASRVAAALMTQVVPNIDCGIDFHTGGASRTNYPQVRCSFSNKPAHRLARAFKAPFMIDSKHIPKSFRAAAHAKGKAILTYEAGESSRFNDFAIEEGIAGALRVMKHLKMRENAPVGRKTRVLTRTTWIRARYSGLFHSLVQPAAAVKKNQLIAKITDPFGESEFDVKSPTSGYVIGVNNLPVVSQGDAVIHVGCP